MDSISAAEIPVYLARSKDLKMMAEDYLGFARYLRGQFVDAKIVCVKIVNHFEYYVLAPDLMREILVTRSDFFPRHEDSVAPLKKLMGSSVMNLGGDVWRARRSMIAPVFSPKSALHDCSDLYATSEYRIEKLIEEGEDLEKSLTRLSMRVMLQTVFSLTNDRYLDKAINALEILSMNGTEDKRLLNGAADDLSSQKMVAKQMLVEIVDEIMASRNPLNPGDDILGRLYSVQDKKGNAMGVEEIRDECLAMFIAGHITTAASLIWWSIYLEQNPSIKEKAILETRACINNLSGSNFDADDFPYLAATIKESMRISPAAAVLLSRFVPKDTEIGDFNVRGGSVLRLIPAVLHNDARWFPDPDVFKPERFLHSSDAIPRGAYMPYGNGPRICTGMHLANQELLILAVDLLTKLSWKIENCEPPLATRLHFAMLPAMKLSINAVRC